MRENTSTCLSRIEEDGLGGVAGLLLRAYKRKKKLIIFFKKNRLCVK